MELIKPSEEHLPSYFAALWRGWSPNTLHTGLDEAEIGRVASDPKRFLALVDDREATGDPIEMPDGSTVPRLPGIRRWMWDGEFAGAMSLRWQPGTEELPPTCLGHIGYSVVPWKRRRGYATQALAELLPLAAAEGLSYVEITTDPDNVASQRVIEANGGGTPEPFTMLPLHGGGPGLRYRIDLARYR
jgi:predicted acetyltransferase